MRFSERPFELKLEPGQDSNEKQCEIELASAPGVFKQRDDYTLLQAKSDVHLATVIR